MGGGSRSANGLARTGDTGGRHSTGWGCVDTRDSAVCRGSGVVWSDRTQLIGLGDEIKDQQPSTPAGNGCSRDACNLPAECL